MSEPGRYFISLDSGPGRLFRAGPLIAGSWSHPDDDQNAGAASGEILIDTGAYGAMIDSEVAERLGLPVQGSQEIHGIHGYGTLCRYRAKLVLPARDADGQDGAFITTLECVGVPSLVGKNEEHGVKLIGIVGRVFLQLTRLEIDFTTGKVKLSIHEPTRVSAAL